MTRHRWHDADDVRRKPSSRVDDLPMFAAPSVAVDTSEQAAEKARPRAKDAHRVILALLTVHDALTCHEIRARTGWSGDFARPSLWELEGMGFLEKCDGKEGRPLVQRPTDTGSSATAYRLTPRGRSLVAEAAA